MMKNKVIVMLRQSTKKSITVPHSLAIFSAILLIWSVQADNSTTDTAVPPQAQQLVIAEDDKSNKQATNIATIEPTPNSPWAVLHLF